MIKQLIYSLTMAATLSTPLIAQGFSGAYLAAQSANKANDYAEAAQYFTEAMAQDPGNGFVMQGAMVASVAVGDFDGAASVAQQMSDSGFFDAYAQTVLIADAFSTADYDLVATLLADDRFEINPLIQMLVSGWVLAASGDIEGANAHFSQAVESGSLSSFAKYHNALAYALDGQLGQAEGILVGEDAYVNRSSVLAHAEILAELGRRDDALDLLMIGNGTAIQDREADDLRQSLSSDTPVEFSQINQPSDAVSEVFLILGDALSNDNSSRLALFFARLAQHLQPDNTEALLLIAQLLSEQDQFDLAVKTYQRIGLDDPFAANAAIGMAGVLQRNDQNDQAIDVLRDLVNKDPADLSAWHSLGDALRQQEKFEDAFAAYSNAIELLPDPNIPGAWRLYYTRAIVAERMQNWEEADWNFRQALRLNPDQPDVLNYLGYSLVERGEKLDEALAMIEKAVEARPQSGFIADSLGWIFYRLGRYEEAVPVMENAVSLLPVDPTVNDHLGDVLWQVGRVREAKFQWRRALSFDPEESVAIRIRDKIANGLDEVLEAENGVITD